MFRIKPIEIITKEEFAAILVSKVPILPSLGWLDIIRTFPCMRPGCNKPVAGTAHHVFGAGGGMKCDDHLTIPLCIWCHLMGPDPIQHMTPEKFEVAMGMSQEDACWRMYKLITDKYYNGDLS